MNIIEHVTSTIKLTNGEEIRLDGIPRASVLSIQEYAANQVREGYKVRVIKGIREAWKLSLRDAKAFVEDAYHSSKF